MTLRIAKIAVPRPNIPATLDYILPGDLLPAAKPGMRVLIPLANSNTTGYLISISDSEPGGRTLKIVHELLDDEPLISAHLLEFTRWVSDYYLTSWGDQIKAALPAGINVEEKEVLTVTPLGRKTLKELRLRNLVTDEVDTDRKIMDHLLANGPERIGLLQKRFPPKSIQNLIAGKLLYTRKQRTGRALEKRAKAVIATENPPPVPEAFWNRSPKRKAAFEKLRGLDQPVLLRDAGKELGISPAVIKGLVDAGLARHVSVRIRRNPFESVVREIHAEISLTPDQMDVNSPIVESIESHSYKTFLLHGVTGSGKTEIYIKAADRALELDRTVLILIPELALTPQFARRYYSAFGDNLAVLHSALSQGERIDEWNRIRKGEAKVVLGTRLSVFSPLERLGLIIVDEEHDNSYKQEEYPVFNARDIAVRRAQMLGASIILGSATPSLESIHNARRGKYTLLRLEKRVFDRPMPEIQLIDLRQQAGTDKEDSNIPAEIRDAISETIANGEQTLVLVGRKGYKPYVICRACGHNFECPNCSISMSYHNQIKALKCHYCGRRAEKPQVCPECGSTSVEAFGFGTQKIEEELVGLFPDAAIARMDRDIITRPIAYHEILNRLRHREIDILVGTQMIAKGHDYPYVTNVVALGLDSILRLPDFRHAEKVFQLITQISGRAGRGERPGKVYVLTYKPNHYAVAAAAKGDWDAFLEKELTYRRELRYPPFGFLALLTIEDFKKDRGRVAAQKIVEKLYKTLDKAAYILGPALAPYARLKNRWRFQIIIKAADRKLLKESLRSVIEDFKDPSRIKVNIDPVSVM